MMKITEVPTDTLLQQADKCICIVREYNEAGVQINWEAFVQADVIAELKRRFPDEKNNS